VSRIVVDAASQNWYYTHPVYFLRSIQRVLQSDRIRSGVRAFQAAEASASRLS
jgi:hypothetical protein